jgi:hypothetical protein
MHFNINRQEFEKEIESGWHNCRAIQFSQEKQFGLRKLKNSIHYCNTKRRFINYITQKKD